MEFTYLPFPQLKQTPAVVVDSFHPNGLVLSHWREAPTPAALREDTSAGMVLQALKQQWTALDTYHSVTANHFDTDALVGVWALLHPTLALEQEQTLRQMAVIGDFRELDMEAPMAEKALQLVCWINQEERNRFYPPFGAEDLEENEVVASVPKFIYFLEALTAVLRQPGLFEKIWRPEYDLVLAGYAQMHGPQTQIIPYGNLGLVVIHTPEPVHYYALFGPTAGYDLVLSCYAGNRYELECKYTTWVDLESRPTLPRPNLQALAQELNAQETSGFTWVADGVTDTGPILRLQDRKLSKAQRYGNPIDRPLLRSSLSPETFTGIVIPYLERIFSDVEPKTRWTWQEMKEFVKKVQ
ncbi:DUF6687 family protein [Rufibacter soli]